MTTSGSGGQGLEAILAEMIRSALDWETENGTPRNAQDCDRREGAEGMAGENTLSDYKCAMRPRKPEESGES